MDIAAEFMSAIINAFEANKRLADRAVAQVPDDKIHTVLDSLKSRKPEDLERTVMIRGELHSVPLALERSLGHTCYHIGQIVQVARIQAGEKWDTLTIPRGGSEQFNTALWGKTGKSHS